MEGIRSKLFSIFSAFTLVITVDKYLFDHYQYAIEHALRYFGNFRAVNFVVNSTPVVQS